MPKFVYQGLTDEQKKRRVDAMMLGAVPAEQPGQPPQYTPSPKDSALELERKKERMAKWRAKRRLEVEACVDLMDAATGFGGFVFKKGVPVEVAEMPNDSSRVYVLKKLGRMVADGLFKKVNGEEKPADAEPVPEPVPEPAEPEKRGRGRPRKSEE